MILFQVFARHFFQVFGAHGACPVHVQVDAATSSGEHKFKVRTLTVAATRENARIPRFERRATPTYKPAEQ